MIIRSLLSSKLVAIIYYTQWYTIVTMFLRVCYTENDGLVNKIVSDINSQ